MSRISVIIPAYQAERFLRDAIASVLAQTLPAGEVIVVDDGSTDATAAVARSFGAAVRLVQQPNAGLGAARNRGIDASTGALLGFLDADDVWPPDSLAVRRAALESDSSLDAVFGHVVQFREDASGASSSESPPEPGPFASSMLIRRASFFRVGLFATHWTLGEFIDWYLHGIECGLRTSVLPDVVLRRRLHAENMGVRQRHARGDYLRILKASLDRRRAQARGEA